MIHQLPEALDPYAILESTSDGVYMLNQLWQFTYLNPRAKTLMSHNGTLLGKSLWEAYPELTDSALGRTHRMAMAHGMPMETEDYFVSLDRWVAAAAYPMSGGMAVFFRDTTAKRAKEEKLLASTTQFRVLFETLTQGVIFQDAMGRIVDANVAAERILGLCVEEMRDRTYDDARWRTVDENGRPLAAEQYPSAIARVTGRSVRDIIIGVFNPQREELRWLRVDAVPWPLSTGVASHHAYTLFIDITEQRRAEATSRASQEHLARAQRVASIGSLEVNFRANTLVWSDETYRIYGLDRDTFTPSLELLLSRVHSDDREKLVAVLKDVSRGVDPPPLEYRIVRPDGEIRTLYREAELTRDNQGRVVGLIATMRDITELRAAERERENLQNQLLHAQRLDALGTLAGGIAHDLNNTLVPVLALTECLQENLGTDNPNAELLTVVRNAAEKARDLVSQILAFSRGEAAERREIHLSSLLKQTMGLVRATVPATISIEVQIDDLPPILADAAQLHQVLLNLITNAAHAIGDTKGKITISATLSHDGPSSKDEAKRKWICLSVTDSGCGMSESTQMRIFEPFFTTKAAGQGTGLGLSVVHGIITAHGGTIQVTSRTEKGTCIDVYLPALERQGTDGSIRK